MEGPTYKISRRQATIRLHNTGEFFIVCDGKRCLYVNGTPVETGDHIRLIHNCVIEVNIQFKIYYVLIVLYG